ncbi:sigma 54-interacting transcriptional regulator [Desulfovibrio ferrophilus]|uniref:sigma 54-interacting transcriptional regulator n=1 Tax=Desulfovibrio ferrophilus TaxID=241368 RepID=UPI001562DB7B|nr:sigma 54-interacting transcriptional regulator [Desulfovibrio ferrophilus]
MPTKTAIPADQPSLFPDACPEPVMRVDCDGRIQYANEASAIILEHFSCQAGEVLPEPLFSKVFPKPSPGKCHSFEALCPKAVFALTVVPFPEYGFVHVYGLNTSSHKLHTTKLQIRDQILDMSQTAVLVTDLEFHVCYTNASFLYMWGFTHKREVHGRRFLDFWDNEAAASKVLQAVRKKEYWAGELMAKGHGRPPFRIRASAMLVKDKADTPLCIAGSFMDITEQAQINEALRHSEEKYRALVETTSDWIWEVDYNGVYSYVSPKVQDILGYPPEILLGQSPFDFMPVKEAARVSAIFHDHISKRKPFKNLENTNLHKDGRHVVLETSADPIFDQDGKYLGYRGIDRDITERKRAQETLKQIRDELEQRVSERTREFEKAHKRLEESEARYRAVLEDQTELICRFTPDGTLTFVNDAYCRYFGTDREQLMGRYFKPLIPEEDRKKCEFHFASLTKDSPVGRLKHRTIMPDGEIRWQHWIDKAIFDEHDRLVEFQSVGRDITASVLVEQTLRRAHKEQDKLRNTLQAVFRSMSDSIITVDQDMRLLNKNQALTSLCTRAPYMIEGKDLNEAFDNDHHPACLRVLSQVLETKTAIRGYRAECRCGTRCNQVTMLNASPLMTSNNQFAGAVLVVRDVTRLDELEKRLDERASYRSIVGKSERMREIYTILDQLTDLKTTVLVMGDSGTGKELIVEALHYGSTCITGPLVKVNCAALAENLLESELFGHVRGAFTGAVQDRMGRFQAAEGGTIFLDEIGDLKPSTQLKLLRVLESKEYERVGDSTTHKADVRVVAATNRNLWDRVQDGHFRKDLYYRLKVMVIKLPSLRDRTGDIPLLTEHFLDHYRTIYGKDITGVTGEVMEVFVRYSWPGNIRELKHSLEHASILCPGGPITMRHLPVELQTQLLPDKHNVDNATLWDSERARISKALEQAHWNKTVASKLIGISRTTLYRKMQELGIKP